MGMPPILSPAQHTAHDRRPPAPPEQTHCARSLSHWSQFPVCGQSHIAHIVGASSPIRRGGGVCSWWGGEHHMWRSYHSLWKQAPHLVVPVRNCAPCLFPLDFLNMNPQINLQILCKCLYLRALSLKLFKQRLFPWFHFKSTLPGNKYGKVLLNKLLKC